MDGRRERLPAGLEPPVEQRQPARFLEEEGHRGFLAALLREPGVFGAEPLQHGQSAPPENASLPEVTTQPLMAASVVTVSMIAEEFLHHLGGDDVHRTAGHVPGRERDAVAVDVEAEIREVCHSCPPDPRALIR